MDVKVIAAAAALFAAGTAYAQMTKETPDFAGLDTDGSGGLTLAEAQVAAPDLTQEDFDRYDADGSGELSAAEFAAFSGASGE